MNDHLSVTISYEGLVETFTMPTIWFTDATTNLGDQRVLARIMDQGNRIIELAEATALPQWDEGDVLLYKFPNGVRWYTYLIEDVLYQGTEIVTSGTRKLSPKMLEKAWEKHALIHLVRNSKPLGEGGRGLCVYGDDCATIHPADNEEDD